MRCLLNGLRTFARRFGSPPEPTQVSPELPDSTLPSAAAPRYFVRVCEFSVSLNLVREVEADKLSPNDLRSLAIECLFGDERDGASMYSAETADSFDPGHGLALVARGIAANCFALEKRQDHEKQLRDWAAKPGSSKPPPAPLVDKRRVSFAIPATVFSEPSASARATPEANLNFAPADPHHYDIGLSDAGTVGGALVDGIRSGQIRWACIGKEDFRGVACSALAACVQRFGDLSTGNPPDSWRPGQTLTASEQLVRLRHMAGERIRKTWPPAAL